MWTTLNFKDRSQTKKQADDICKIALDIEFEQDWSVGLGATLGNGKKIKKILFTRIFPGKADSVILLGFACCINSQNFMKIVWALFEKMDFFSYVNYP